MAYDVQKLCARQLFAVLVEVPLSSPAYATAEVPVADARRIELPNGTQLGRYVTQGTLGAGGMGVVYRAIDPDSGRMVALKTLHERDPVALYHLKREFRSLADVSHPNLISLGELAIVGGRPFFTMELIDGVDFKHWIESGPTPWEPGYFDRLRYGLRQIVLGLRALHAAGKVHCDLKPSNVLVTYDDRIVVVDFGLARERPMASQDISSRVWGTARYMAPEQARTNRVGAAADWYSLGVLLYRFLSGAFPFTGSTMEILLAKQKREPPPPSTVAEGVPGDLDALCVELLRRDPAARPGSARILELLGGHITGQVSRDTSTLALRSVFIGRREELALLNNALESTREQHAAVLLHGDSGVGKTALVRHFFERTRAWWPNAVTLTGRCYQRDSMPYRALDSVIDSLSDHLRRQDQVQLAHGLPSDASLLGRVFPVLARVPAIAKAGSDGPEIQDRQQMRARVLAALRHVLAYLAEQAPVIVFIDDLQWADADGLGLIRDLFNGPHAPRVLLLATVRTEADHPPLVRLVDLDQVVQCNIGALPHHDAEALAEALLHRVDPSRLGSASAIAEEAAGHPLFIDELVRFRARGQVGSTGRAATLDDAIWQRLERLDESGRALMTTIAIAEVPLGIDAASMAAGYSVEQLERVAEQLTSEHLARAAPTIDDSLALEPYHDRVREVLVARLEPAARAYWHRRLADALYHTGAADCAPFELVRHLTLAGDPQHAAELAGHAAERASASLAFESAVELYRLALGMGHHAAATALALRRGLADALVQSGRGCEAATVLQQIAAAVDDSQLRADCLRRAAEQLLLNGHLDRGLALLGCVAKEFDVSVPRTDTGTLLTLAFRRLRLRIRGLRWRERAPADVSPRELLVQDVHHSVGAILGLVDPVRGSALASQATLLALRLGVRDRVVRAMSTEAVARASVGDHKRANALVERATRLAHEAGDVGAMAWVTGVSAVVAYTAGRFTDVLRAVDHAIELEGSLGVAERERLSTGGVYETGVLRYCRLISLAYLGRCNELRDDFHDWLQDARRRGDRFTAANAARGLNIIWLFDDDPDRARSELVADSWTPPQESFHIQHWTVLRSTVQIHLYCGTAGRAREELAPELDRSKKALLMRVCALRGEQDWMLGRLALAEAEAARAGSRAQRRRRRQALSAAKRLHRLGLPQSRTAASLVRAAVAFQRGDLDTSLEQLLRAEAVASRSGLRLMQAAAQRRRGQLIAGSAGQELIDAVDAWAGDQGIRAPARIVRMYAPGFFEGG